MENWAKFKDLQLPPREQFFSRLRQCECSVEDYAHAQAVWAAFHIQNMGEYHDLYLKLDVLLLMVVWEEFTRMCMKNYELDPAHYVSARSQSWDAMLKFTKVEMELNSDGAIFKMMDDGLRGGICQISKRYCKANNPYIPLEYDRTKPNSYIVYLDANNLYGWAMSQPQPKGDYKWLSQQEIAAIDWRTQTVDQPRGYMVECDLDYPAELHEEHNDYPLAAERMIVNYECLSQKQIEINRCYNMSRGNKTTKLIPNLLDKRHYICDYLNLKFYLEHGLKLVKVHRVVSYQQDPWLKKYIVHNQILRAAATNEFEKEFFKLMNNSIYGKTCENLKNRSDIRLATTRKQCKKWLESQDCLQFRIFGENLVAVEMQKCCTKIDKPTPVGLKTLEGSKLLMYEFFYDKLKVWYGNKVHLLFTDTDSLMLEIETEDVYKDMKEHSELFDFSGYPRDHPNYSNANNKVIGKMKDETCGRPIQEYVALRPKMYSFIELTEHGLVDHHRAKGIQAAASKNLHHAEYLAQLRTPRENYLINRRIGSKCHKLYTIEVEKRGLCAFDDKRLILNDGRVPLFLKILHVPLLL